MSVFASVDRVAGVSGLAPVPRDSGRISGNLKRPRRYDRRLLRACYLSAQIAIRTDPASRTYYDRKMRHEALDVRGEVEDLRRLAVAATGLKLGAA